MSLLPKISILVPTYNRVHFLEQALESIVEQSYQNLEVIISDNASTDTTPKLVRKFLKDKRFFYFRNSHNIGMVPNWRRALRAASGDWVLILSDDDYFVDKSYLEQVASLICSSPVPLVAVCSNVKIQQDCLISQTNMTFPSYLPGAFYFLHYQDRFFFYLVATFFHRDTLMSLNPFQRKVLGADSLEFLRICLRGFVGFLPTAGTTYRVHSQNTMFFSPWKEYVKNFDVIFTPYREALKMGNIPVALLNKWKYRLLNWWVTQVIYIFSQRRWRERKDFLCFLQRIWTKYPQALTPLIYPKSIAYWVFSAKTRRLIRKRIESIMKYTSF